MVAVTWSMVLVFLVGGTTLLALVLAGFFLLLNRAMEKQLNVHVAHVERHVNRVVGIADAAHAEYEGVNRRLDATDAEVEGLGKQIEQVKHDVRGVKSRLGME